MTTTSEMSSAGTGSSTDDTSSGNLPFVSVIIPVRNDARRLARCLDSLANQVYPADSFEVIVVDNGSHDDSPVVAEAGGAKVLRYPNLRVGALRNRGVAVARGSILAFVDSDHETPPDWLQTAVEFLCKDNALVLGSPCLADPHGTWVQRTWELHRTRGAARRRVDWLGAGNMFVRRIDFLQVDGFDENLVAAEDVDLCVRLTKLPGNIISDMRVANIHHGEPRTLADFCRKEFWRGSSGVRAFFAHGMPLHELPSLIFPLYHLAAVVAVIVLAILVFAGWSWWLVAAAFALLGMPSILLSLKVSRQTQSWSSLPALATLYLAYGLTRALALFKP